MKHAIQSTEQPTQHAACAPRFDLYGAAHKGLRACMAEALTAAGRMDPADDQDINTVTAKVRALLDLCKAHLNKENHFIHSALEARAPGSSAAVACAHAAHEQSFLDLAREVCDLEAAQGSARDAAARRLYCNLALFVAENLRHMHDEESDIAARLWETHSDAELMDLHRRLVASIPPGQVRMFLRWIIPSATPEERHRILADIKRNAPPAVFTDTLTMARSHLDDRSWDKLQAVLRT